MAVFGFRWVDNLRRKVGWKPGGPDMLLSNPGFGDLLRVVVTQGKASWDQWLFFHRGQGVGCVPVVMKDGLVEAIYLVHAWRPVLPVGPHGGKMSLTKLGRMCWEIPRGFSKPGELLNAGARREAWEEMSIRFTGEPSFLCWYEPNTTFIVDSVGIYLAVGVEGAEPKADGVEVSSVRRWTIVEIRQAIIDEKISDGFLFAALAALDARGLLPPIRRG